MIAEVFRVELLKLRRSKITWLSWLAFSIMPLIVALFAWIVKEPARAGELGLLGQKATLSGLRADWSSYFALLLSAVGLAGMILVSVIAAYVFGREYADGTAKNLLTLPVRREAFVVAKLAVVLVWFLGLTGSLLAEGALACAWLGLPGFSIGFAVAAARDVFLAALVAWLLVPITAWVAIAGRGYLAPLGFTMFMLLLGNVLGATGWGKWFPWSIVPLFAGVAGPRVDTLASGSLLVLLLAFSVGVAGCAWSLRHADNSQ